MMLAKRTSSTSQKGIRIASHQPDATADQPCSQPNGAMIAAAAGIMMSPPHPFAATRLTVRLS